MDNSSSKTINFNDIAVKPPMPVDNFTAHARTSNVAAIYNHRLWTAGGAVVIAPPEYPTLQGGNSPVSPDTNTLHNIIVRVKDAGGKAQRTSPLNNRYSYFINGEKHCSPLFSYPDLRAASIIITNAENPSEVHKTSIQKDG